MSSSHVFEDLHPGVKRWIYQQGWEHLREIQEKSIVPIMSQDRDIVIASSTASGKTEAAFLPAMSALALAKPDGVGVLYISPLKALINDQYRRLRSLAENIDMPLTPWHGDVNANIKKRLKKNPKGILLITPESLEALLITNPGWCVKAFGNLQHVIIDEFHNFLGTERGQQLQSLLHRLEFLTSRKIPRIALSATLNDLASVGVSLRPDMSLPVEIISSSQSQADLRLQLRGYTNFADNDKPSAMTFIMDDLYKITRGKTNLVFANSRARVEEVTAGLSDRAHEDHVPNEFFAHHGSLAREIREQVETRLQKGDLPTTCMCTSTLELGIDIGSVDSVAQINSPPSVSSLRQRLGRSGRRDVPAVLRLFVVEQEISEKTHIVDRMRLQTVQCIAMINLLLQKWYEPSLSDQYHFSTLVQQTLAVIGQYGAVQASQLYKLLCATGPFAQVDQALFAELLRSLSEQQLITQMQDTSIALGELGEKVVGHYSFYTAFQTPEEYRMQANGRVLGSLPIVVPLIVGQYIIFAGSRWQILSVDTEAKVCYLQQAYGGKPPIFDGSSQNMHLKIREEMYRLYQTKEVPVYLDNVAKQHLQEGYAYFDKLDLVRRRVIYDNNNAYIFTWQGDMVANTLSVWLTKYDLKAQNLGGVIEVKDVEAKTLNTIFAMMQTDPTPSTTELAVQVADTKVEKHDHYLSANILAVGYGARNFDIPGTLEFLQTNFFVPVLTDSLQDL